MPIYEYRCDRCEHEFEREQRISDDPVKTCPECRSRRVKRLISQTSFVLKGSGWYSDLYSGASNSKDVDKGKSDSSSADKSESKSDGSKGDSKSGKDKGKGKGKGKSGKAKSAA